MTNLVPAEDIETIVGASRHPTLHLARAIDDEQMVYILHSARCKDSGIDLRHCDHSIALHIGGYHGIHDKTVHAIVSAIPHSTDWEACLMSCNEGMHRCDSCAGLDLSH